MKIIETMQEYMDDELDGAEEYYNEALAFKDNDPNIAEIFYNMANIEIEHYNNLHTVVSKLIDKYKQENGNPPEGMLAVYNYLHKKAISKMAEVKALGDMYKS